MIDYNIYNYLKIGNYTNVVFREVKSDPMDKTLTIHPFMNPMISKVSLLNPNWLFVGKYGMPSRFHPDDFCVASFDIYEGTDEIGSIDLVGHNDSTYKWCFNNERIRNSKTRRGGMCTSDFKKGIKIVNTYFSSKSVDELKAKALQLSQSIINQGTWSFQRRYDQVLMKVVPSFSAYILANIDEMRTKLAAYGLDDDMFTKMQTAYQDFHESDVIMGAFRKNEGAVVLDRGTEYILIPADDKDNPIICKRELLPEKWKANLGILKMTEPETFVSDVGIRIDANTFYLL